MLWIYGMTIVVSAIMTGAMFYGFIRNKTLVVSLTIITTIAVVCLTHFFFIPHYFYDQILEASIRKDNPFMNTIADKIPGEFNTYVTQLKMNTLAKGSKNNEIYYNEELLNNLMMKYGPVASNESLFNYIKSNVEFDKKLMSIDPMLVLFHEFPDRFLTQIDFMQLNDKVKDLYKNPEVFNTAQNAIQSGIDHPQNLPTQEQLENAQTIFRKVIAQISKKHGSEKVISTFQHPDFPDLDKKAAANIVIAFYDALISQGQDKAVLVAKASLLVNKNKDNDEKI